MHRRKPRVGTARTRATQVGTFATLAVLIGGVAAASIPVPINGIPVPVVKTSGQAFGGSAGVPLVYLNALDLGTADVAAATVAPAESIVKSGGVSGHGAGVHSYARATNVDANVLSGAIPLSLVSTVQQATKTGSPKAKTGGLVNLPAAPLANVDVVANSAHAVFPTPSQRVCSKTLTPLSVSQEQLASADVLPGVAGGALSVTDKTGGTVYTNSEVGLIQEKGQTKTESVESQALTQLTDVSLLGGAVKLKVAAPPTLTAVATGKAGGATVTYNAPLIDVYLGSTKLGVLDNANKTIAISALGVTLSIGTLQDVKKAANGTSVSGDAALVSLNLAPVGIKAVNLQVAPETVSASVPVGGVSCVNKTTPTGGNPLSESHKDVSADTVPPGQSFNYTITAPNRGVCTLHNVTVTDTIPSGLIFDGSTPPPTSHSGDSLTYKLGTLAPNATKNITLRFTVPDGASTGHLYVNHAVVSGACDGTTYKKPISVSGPKVGPVNPGGCSLGDSDKAADHIDVKHGETFNYYVHVFNSGGSPCDSVSVKDTLVSGVAFVSCSNSCTHSGSTVTWSDLGTLDSGASLTLSLEVRATAKSGELSNKAVISTPSNPGRPVTVRAHGPKVTTVSVLAPPQPAMFHRHHSGGGGNGNGGNGNGGNGNGNGGLPDTGGNPLLPITGLGLVTLAAVVRNSHRLRRRR